MALAWIGLAEAAAPTFENRTPVGFSSQDSTTQEDFVVGNEVTVRVDLNQAVTDEFPLIGHFHSLERSEQLSTTDTDGLQIDIAMVDVAPFGTNSNLPADGVTQATTFEAVIHMAWIEDSPETIGFGIHGRDYGGLRSHVQPKLRRRGEFPNAGERLQWPQLLPDDRVGNRVFHP